VAIPFDQIAADLLARSESFCRELFPAGKVEAGEWRIGNIHGDPGHSLSINLRTGVWKDWAGDDAGADLISLYAAARGMGMGDAARDLAPHLCNGHAGPARLAGPVAAAVVKPAPDEPPFDLPEPAAPDLPPPSGPPSVPKATALYRYTDRFYVARFDHPATDTEPASKTFQPQSWDGTKWTRKAPPKPRPLFGLDDLANRPDAAVLVVEGEKAAQAASLVLKGYTVVTWAGGASSVATADWRPLEGRRVDIWPDADDPGRKAAADIAGLLLPLCRAVRVVDTTEAPSDGWDLADAIRDGWGAKEIIAWGTGANADGTKRLRAVEMPAPEPAKAPAAKPPKQTTPTEPADDGQTPAYILWEKLNLGRNDRGPYATEANALRIIVGHDDYAGRIWLDEFSQRLMITDKGVDRMFSDTDAMHCLVWMQDTLQLQKMPMSAVQRAAILVGERNKRHPVKAWLETLAWDGIERLPHFISDVFGADQSPYTAAVGRCWLVAMVSRIYNPGGQADNVPVFEGSQGLRKSTALRALVGEEWFLESVRNPIKDPDKFSQSLQGKWLVEIPEIDRVGGRFGSLDDLTGMITIRKDTYRMPYARSFMDFPRQTILAGTTNVTQWNPDQTGGRRYWPITCKSVNVDFIRENREQLFAEALARYKRGESWWDVPDVDAKEAQSRRRIADEWEQIIERYEYHYCNRDDWREGPQWVARLLPLEEMTVGDILENALGIPIGKWTNSDQVRVAKCLTAMGWHQVMGRVEGRRVRLYRKKTPPQ
jgi:putative DNA primase/helicase